MTEAEHLQQRKRLETAIDADPTARSEFVFADSYRGANTSLVFFAASKATNDASATADTHDASANR